MYILFINNKKIYSIQKNTTCIYLFIYLFIFVLSKLPLNTKQKFEFAYQFIVGEKLLPGVVGVVSFLAKKPLHFHGTIFSVSSSLFKI